MNNLKRVLSLALASVMLIGMMVVGVSAKEFTDADEIEHPEAVDILVALDIINGKEDGTYFAPKDNVTRGEMAKMIAVAMKGGNDVDTGTKGVPSFTDIAGHWAESYIEYCYDLGIIAGRGDGTFDPNANVTGTEVTKMVLSALGYDATAYKLTGASWATRTDELARTAEPYSLYEDLSGVTLNVPATRDTAAQIIWNGLQDYTKKVTPSTNTSNGEVEWKYDDGNKMLKLRYDADIWYGTYAGNHDTGFHTATNEGEVTVYGGTRDDYKGTQYAYVPSDLDISNIGEKVKVIWKDKTGGTSGKPDNKDVIYGVFNTHETQVLNVKRDKIEGTGDGPDSTTKIKVDGVEYSTADTTSAETAVYMNYTTGGATATTAAQRKTVFEALKATDAQKQTADTVKFILNDDGKVETAYVVTYNVGRVTSVTSSKVTITNIGSIDIADNDIYEDIKKDDVVAFTRFYSDSSLDDAFFTVTKAEVVEGKITAVKNTENLAVDGTTYKIWHKTASLPNVSDDTLAKVDASNLDDVVRLFLVGGVVYGMQSVDDSGKDYAIVTDLDWGNGLGSNLNGAKVTVLYADGTEETLNLHKDSYAGKTGNVENPIADGSSGQVYNASDDTTLYIGSVVKYTKSNGKLKITEIVNARNSVTAPTGQFVYDKDSKTLNYDGTNKAVAASDAIFFVVKNSGDNSTNVTANDDFYVYKLRDMGKISGQAYVNAVRNDNGQIKVGVAVMANKPTGASTDRVYGVVSSVIGSKKVGDDTYKAYTVATNDGSYDVYTNDTFKKGYLVTFEPSSDNTYDNGDVKLLSAYAASESQTYIEAAAKGYDTTNRILTYYLGTKDNGQGIYEGYKTSACAGGDVNKPNTYTADKDVKIFYVNQDDAKMADEIGINEFDSGKGYANIVFTVDSDDLVQVIIVETSNKLSISDDKADTPNAAFRQ